MHVACFSDNRRLSVDLQSVTQISKAHSSVGVYPNISCFAQSLKVTIYKAFQMCSLSDFHDRIHPSVL